MTTHPRTDPRPLGLEAVAWRAVGVYRVLALAYGVVLVTRNAPFYARPTLGWAVLTVMIAWTAVMVASFATRNRPGRGRWLLLGADLLVTCLLIASTLWIETPQRLEAGAPSITTVWGAGVVLAWAAYGGPWRGVLSAAAVGAVTVAIRWRLDQPTVENLVLLALAGGVAGYVVQVGRRTEALLARVTSLEAAAVERERLARRIHDGVLQVLALVQRRGDPELARLAGQQEEALRLLVSSAPVPVEEGHLDLRELLLPLVRPHVSLSNPATPVPLPAACAREVAAGVAAALDNVARHVGANAPAWVLVEDEDATVTVSVRDEGPGVSAERLAEAATDGRMGVARSIRGRIEDLGGTLTLTSAPGQGLEVELRVPRES